MRNSRAGTANCSHRQGTREDRSRQAIGVGARVAKADKQLALEAMNMQMTIYPSFDGVADEICVQNSDAVESKGLNVKIRRLDSAFIAGRSLLKVSP